MPLPTLTAILEAAGPWLALMAFGAFHGLNPGMGWLFALALGLQQSDERIIFRALIPIALGHAASIGLMALLLLAFGTFIRLELLSLLTAALLLAFGVYKLFRYYRHPRWVGMRVSLRELFNWSFLMATAHGAGLMLAPLLLGLTGGQALSSAHDHAGHGVPAATATPLLWVGAIGVHTAAMLTVMIIVAWVVYRKLGLAVLRQNWVNFDLIWAITLLIVGAGAFFTALTPTALAQPTFWRP